MSGARRLRTRRDHLSVGGATELVTAEPAQLAVPEEPVRVGLGMTQRHLQVGQAGPEGDREAWRD